MHSLGRLVGLLRTDATEEIQLYTNIQIALHGGQDVSVNRNMLTGLISTIYWTHT